MPVRDWALWQRPRRVVVFMLGMQALALALLGVVLTVADPPTPRQWLWGLVLAACGTCHALLTRREQERRRERSGSVLIDFVGIWIFPAILLLPATLVVLLVAVLRVQRWFVSRRPAHNFVFSSVSHCAAAVLAQLCYTALGPHDWGSLTTAGTWHEFAAILVAAVVYEAVQIVYVGGVLALGAASATPSVRTVLGSRADNLIEAVTTGLGAATAVLLVVIPPLVSAMILVSVVLNRFTELGQLRHDVRTDVKTGVLNMRGWTESARRELARSGRAGIRTAILMVDLDNFKEINDTYGHPAGDATLRATAAELDAATRPSDLVARYGGEEFLVLLTDTGTEAARLAADRIRERIATLNIETTDKRGNRVVITERTISVGIAVHDRHAHTMEELIQLADTAVYEAKESGRNRVRLAAEPEAGAAGQVTAAENSHRSVPWPRNQRHSELDNTPEREH